MNNKKGRIGNRIVKYTKRQNLASFLLYIIIFTTFSGLVSNVFADQLPVAKANFEGTYSSGSQVQVYGGYSYDPDGKIVSYNWFQLSGPPIKISPVSEPFLVPQYPEFPPVPTNVPIEAFVTFIAPFVSVEEDDDEEDKENEVEILIQLTVTNDKGVTATDTVEFEIQAGSVNQPPTANAGIDQIVKEGDTVNLDGLLSTDPDGAITA